VLVLGETLSWNQPLGALVVIVGILFAQRRIRLGKREAVISEHGRRTA
jgi:drug/metabolite transporter (DMT)-like permease